MLLGRIVMDGNNKAAMVKVNCETDFVLSTVNCTCVIYMVHKLLHLFIQQVLKNL